MKQEIREPKMTYATSKRSYAAKIGASIFLTIFFNALAAQDFLPPTVAIKREREIYVPSKYLVDFDASQEPFRHAHIETLAWSSISNQIAVANRRMALVDPESGNIKPIEAGIKLAGTSELFLDWSITEPVLTVVKATSASIIDTLGAPSVSTVATIHNTFPNFLIASGAAVIRQGEQDLLVIAGEGSRDPNVKGADIAAYDLKDGRKVMAWRFPDDGTKYYINRAKVAAAKSSGDVLVAAYVHRVIRRGDQNAAPLSEDDIWIVNLSQGKIHCRLNFYDNDVKRDSSGRPLGSFNGVDMDGNGMWIVASHNQFADVFETSSCRRVTRIFQHPSILDSASATPVFGSPKFSKDSRWLLGYAVGKTNIRLWRVQDWKLVYDQPFKEVVSKGVDFNGDSTRFAIGAENKIVVFRIESK